MTVRAASIADVATLFKLVREFPTPTPPTVGAYEQAFRAKLSDPTSCVMVAESNGDLVGYLSGCRHSTFYAGGQTAWVDEVLVTEALRGTGIGRQLMEAFEVWAHSAGCVLVSLATRGAAPFYERIGYTSKAGYFKKYLDIAQV